MKKEFVLFNVTKRLFYEGCNGKNLRDYIWVDYPDCFKFQGKSWAEGVIKELEQLGSQDEFVIFRVKS